MVRIDFGRDDSGVAGVGEFGPAIDSIPALAKVSAVVEDDLYSDGEDKVTFAVEIDGGEVLDLLLFFRFGKPPLRSVGGDAFDGVVEELSSVDGLIEEAAEARVGCRRGGVVGLAGRG